MNMLPNAFVQMSEPTSLLRIPVHQRGWNYSSALRHKRVQTPITDPATCRHQAQLPVQSITLGDNPARSIQNVLEAILGLLQAMIERQQAVQAAVVIHSLYGDPSNRNDNIHALLLGGLPLVAVRSILLVVPVRTYRAVHAAAPVLLRLARRPNVLDDCAVGNVLVAGLCGLGALGLDCCGFDEGFEDGLLGRC